MCSYNLKYVNNLYLNTSNDIGEYTYVYIIKRVRGVVVVIGSRFNYCCLIKIINKGFPYCMKVISLISRHTTALLVLFIGLVIVD